jgi:hypothetical protein
MTSACKPVRVSVFMPLVLLLGAMQLALVPAAMSAPANTPAADALLTLYRTRLEVGMVMYDDTLGDYRARAEQQAGELETQLIALVDAHRGRGDEAVAAQLEALRLRIDRAVRGGEGSGVGILGLDDYDPALSAQFQTDGRELAMLLEKLTVAGGDPGVQRRAAVALAEVLANYVGITGSPFGVFSYSASTDEADLSLLAARAGDALRQAATAQAVPPQAMAKWHLLERALARPDGGQGYPWLAWRFGNDILDALEPSE